jgi:dCMP deaminase
VSFGSGATAELDQGVDECGVSVHGGRMKKKRDPRPDWDAYFLDIARVVARRGNCLRRQVAAVIVDDRRIISTGYNGTPRGVRNCMDGGCERCAGDAASGRDLGECICAHAEENAIAQAACHGIALRGATLYCTLSPCLTCARMIVNAGIRAVVYGDVYQFSRQTRALLREAGVKCRRVGRSRC